MKGQNGVGKTQEDLLEKIAALAAAYTPEWHFDAECPDAGTAIAMLFAEIFSGTEERFERIPEKNRLSFFEMQKLAVRPAQPAGGYVTFGLSSDEFGGVFLPKGIPVSGAAGPGTSGEAAGKNVIYRTCDALYVTPARLTTALLVDGERDYIAKKDIERPFLPFVGEEANLQEHIFYICQNEVLDVSGQAEIRLDFKIPGIKEESWPDWMTDAAKCSFSYSTEDGFEEYKARRMEKGALVLVRTKSQENPAARELFGKSGYWLCCRYRGAWQREPFLAQEIRLTSRREHIEPDILWNQEGQQENADMFPFGERPAPYAECYFASAEALGKTGAQICMSFELDYEKIPFDNSYQTERQWKLVMKRADFTPEPEYDITVEQVVWEYYNGAGWSRLMLPEEWETLFNGANERGGRQVSLIFPCPPDASLLEWQSAPTRYLRVRVLRMKNLYKPKGTYIVPVISKVQFAFDYRQAGQRPDMTVAKNNRKESIYAGKERKKPFILFCGLPEKRLSLYLGFHQPFGNGPIRFLFSMEDDMDEELPCLQFSASEKQGFAPLSVVDETGNFRKSGMITLIGREGFSRQTVCGETAYWVCITDVQGTWRKTRQKTGTTHAGIPRINGIFQNAARVLADSGQLPEIGGAAGNQKPQGVTRIDGSYSYVNYVTNPLPLSGGYDAEPVEEALRRGSAALRHRGRAVTASDFEALAKEAARSVKKVRCCPGRNAEGAYEPGAVTVVLLLEEFADGKMYFAGVREQVKAYIGSRTSGNLADRGRLYIIEPVFLELDCQAEVVVTDMDSVFEVQEEIIRRVTRFLHPLTGNYDGGGWKIGVIPNETQVINAVRGIQGLVHIERLRLSAYRRKEGRRIRVPLGERDAQAFGFSGESGNRLFALPLPGTCRASMKVE